MLLNELFGSYLFNDSVMKKTLPPCAYEQLKNDIMNDNAISLQLADVIADGMKNWAIAHNVTHFTHWFQPLTELTAEKHDSFINKTSDGKVIMEFCGKELIKGEPDASSFPSGELRSTFEARGYTAWDPTSYAFIKDNILCIPTAFCSYNGEALDKKTPLLRSMEALNKQALRLLRALGRKDVKRVTPMVGNEQEYFIIDRKDYLARLDLRLCGRTLFGAPSPKGQELDDHYFGAIKPRVVDFMKEVDEELWKLGIFAKTKHNEVAPAQHELASIYCSANVACDQNQLTMEIMKKVARKRGLACLLAEKPFEYVNGIGKHNNWSLFTDDGINLFDPTADPCDNSQFLIVLCAVICAVDKHADLLRESVATAGNDHRLGASEAPPAIVSMYLGDELTEILTAIAKGQKAQNKAKSKVELGARILPNLPKDSTDRNRTSPLAFTGNKFEFRMLGSNSSVADCNTTLNTVTAEQFGIFALRLENAKDKNSEINAIISDTMNLHGRIIFNGNNYSKQWAVQAKALGLPNLPTTVDALKILSDENNLSLFESQKVLSRSELLSRKEIGLENYCKTIAIEGRVMVEIFNKYILCSSTEYLSRLSKSVLDSSAVNPLLKFAASRELIAEIAQLTDSAYEKAKAICALLSQGERIDDYTQRAEFFRDEILTEMNLLRADCDLLEQKIAKKYTLYPDYADILFGVD